MDREVVPHVYQALVSREDCERQERQNFLQKIYRGSVGNMVAAFVQDGQLSQREIDRLQKLLEDARPGRDMPGEPKGQ